MLCDFYYYYQFFQRWVPQKAKMPVQGGPQNKQTYTCTHTVTIGTYIAHIYIIIHCNIQTYINIQWPALIRSNNTHSYKGS